MKLRSLNKGKQKEQFWKERAAKFSSLPLPDYKRNSLDNNINSSNNSTDDHEHQGLDLDSNHKNLIKLIGNRPKKKTIIGLDVVIERPPDPEVLKSLQNEKKKYMSDNLFYVNKTSGNIAYYGRKLLDSPPGYKESVEYRERDRILRRHPDALPLSSRNVDSPLDEKSIASQISWN